jgi:hypothetical protein
MYLANGSLRDLNSQLHELAVDPRCAPTGIVTAHGPDKITSFLRNSWAARATVTNLPGPIPAEALAMPSDDGFRFDDD